MIRIMIRMKTRMKFHPVVLRAVTTVAAHQPQADARDAHPLVQVPAKALAVRLVRVDVQQVVKAVVQAVAYSLAPIVVAGVVPARVSAVVMFRV
jgi:hypothetical protein